jgi:hypothetical protein
MVKPVLHFCKFSNIKKMTVLRKILQLETNLGISWHINLW